MFTLEAFGKKIKALRRDSCHSDSCLCRSGICTRKLVWLTKNGRTDLCNLYKNQRTSSANCFSKQLDSPGYGRVSFIL